MQDPGVPIVEDCDDSGSGQIRCGHIRAAEEGKVTGVAVEREAHRQCPRSISRDSIGNVHREIPHRGNPTETKSEVYGVRSHGDAARPKISYPAYVCGDIDTTEHSHTCLEGDSVAEETEVIAIVATVHVGRGIDGGECRPLHGYGIGGLCSK